MTAAVEETGLGQAAGKAATLVRDSVKTVIAASMVGTAIEFYDFYAYGTAAANYFPHIFFSAKDNPTVALLMSLLTFAVAFIARPLGSLIFGHFGDRMGRKTTLVVSLMTMGVGTFLIGCLPTYDQVGVGAVAILCLLRFIQGIGLGGVVIRRVVLRVVLPVVLGLLTECHNRSFSVCSSTNLRGTKLNIP